MNPDLKVLREQAKRISGGGDCKCKGPGVISRVCEKASGLQESRGEREWAEAHHQESCRLFIVTTLAFIKTE